MQAEAGGGSTGKASVLLVDDHALLRTGVADIINQEPDLRVVAEAGNGVEAIEAYERHHPDVTLLALRPPVMEGSWCCTSRRVNERRCNYWQTGAEPAESPIGWAQRT